MMACVGASTRIACTKILVAKRSLLHPSFAEQFPVLLDLAGP